MADDLILILDEDDLILETESDETEFVDDRPYAHQYDEYTGSYEVTPSFEEDITLPTEMKLMINDLVIKALPEDPADAEITGTNTVTPMASVSGQNITLGNTNTGISVTALGGGTASASVTATGTEAGFVSVGMVLDTATLSAASATTSATSYIQSVVIPTGKMITVETESGASVSIANAGFVSVGLTGEISIDGQTVVSDSDWETFTPDSMGTYYGKTVVNGDILKIAYPVGSLYATETSTADPATILGFGTWTKKAPKDLTWNDAEVTWADSVGVTDEVYVWKRTA